MILPASSALTPGATAASVLLHPLRIASLFAMSWGHKPHWLLESGVLGAVPLLQVLKFGMLDVGSKPFAPQGEYES